MKTGLPLLPGKTDPSIKVGWFAIVVDRRVSSGRSSPENRQIVRLVEQAVWVPDEQHIFYDIKVCELGIIRHKSCWNVAIVRCDSFHFKEPQEWLQRQYGHVDAARRVNDPIPPLVRNHDSVNSSHTWSGQLIQIVVTLSKSE